MPNSLIESVYKSLGNNLEKLQALIEEQENHSELRKTIEDALAFYGHLEEHYELILLEKKALALHLREYWLKEESLSTDKLDALIKGYVQLQKVGASPRVIYELAKRDGVKSNTMLLKVISNTFALPWQEAKVLIEEFEAKPIL